MINPCIKQKDGLIQKTNLKEIIFELLSSNNLVISIKFKNKTINVKKNKFITLYLQESIKI